VPNTRLIVLLLAPLALAACEWGEGEGLMHREQNPLVGTWRTVSMEVWLNAQDDPPGVRALSVDEEVWSEVFGLQPAETRFDEDGSYETVYRDTDGELVQRMRGHWIIEDDEVTLFQVEPEAENQTYEVSGLGTLQIRFEGWVDWNSDGERTDRYVGVHRRLRSDEISPRTGFTD
jgi:hypothetical protein